MLVQMSREGSKMQRNEVNGYLNSLEAPKGEVNEMLEKGDQEIQKKCLRNCCSSNRRSSYKIEKMAREKIAVVSKLKNKGHFDVVVDRQPSAPVDEKPMDETVGLDLVCSMRYGNGWKKKKWESADFMEWGVWGKPPSEKDQQRVPQDKTWISWCDLGCSVAAGEC